MECAWCGDKFTQKKVNQIYCSHICCRLAYNKRRRDERAAAKAELKKLHRKIFGERKKITSTLNQVAREADECGLSYGKYKVQLKMGKTYEELKTEYESRRY